LTCILPPRAEGIPVWKSDKIGEDFIIKLPQQFKQLFAGEDRQLTEEIGRALAEWSKGAAPKAKAELTDDRLMQLDAALAEAAEHGLLRLQQEWTGLHPTYQRALEAALRNRHKPRAIQVDAGATP
jgi:hypothetical protein